MTTLAALKRRLKPGDRLLCIENTMRPILDGTTREVLGVGSTAWQFTLVDTPDLPEDLRGQLGTIQHSDWPKASGYSQVDDDTFRVALVRAPEHSVTLRFLS